MFIVGRHAVRRYRVSPRITNLRTLAVLGVGLCFIVMAITPVFAQPATRDQAMQLRAQKTLQIAQEYVNRKVYRQAEILIQSLQGSGELAEFVGDSDKEVVVKLSGVVKTALVERGKIAKALMGSDQLVGNGEFDKARELLSSIKDNDYLQESERNQVAVSLKQLNDKANAAKAQVAVEAPVVKPFVEVAPVAAA